MIKNNKEIGKLVSVLPEIYQPIFNHSEFTSQASRNCFDRLETIFSIYDYLAKEKGRPLKVLDLGCAQGFFSLNLASRGALVTGVDYSQPNIDVCNKLSEENDEFKVEFLLGSIEHVVRDNISEKEYDLVLGLSVFHHIVYEHGVDYVLELFNVISQKIETGIFEFALNSEPLYWADSQHPNPRAFIESFSFQHELSMYGTHLSDVERPLFFSSNKYWNIDNQYGIIDKHTKRSHDLDNFYHKDNRHYYFSDDLIIKIFLQKTGDDNYTELHNEYNFLSSPINGFPSPEIIHYGSNLSESWLVRKVIKGTLFLDFLIEERDYDDERIIEQILEQVSILEDNNLYHNDLRPWNVIINDDANAFIIDYGAISESILDGDDLYGQILSFFVFLKEIAQHKVRKIDSSRPSFVSPEDFPAKYKAWLSDVWRMPSNQWSFRGIYTAFKKNKPSESNIAHEIPSSRILESYLSTLENHFQWRVKDCVAPLINKVNELHEKYDVQNTIFSGKYIEILEYSKTLEGNNKSLKDALDIKNKEFEIMKKKLEDNINYSDSLKQEIKSVNKENYSIYMSRSWRLTYPLRLIMKCLKVVFNPVRLISVIKKIIKKCVSKASGFIKKKPFLKNKVIKILNRFPVLKFRLKRMMSIDTPSFNQANGITSAKESHNDASIGEFDSGGDLLKDNTNKPHGINHKQKSILESWFY